jgi:hypothetical protein
MGHRDLSFWVAITFGVMWIISGDLPSASAWAGTALVLTNLPGEPKK